MSSEGAIDRRSALIFGLGAVTGAGGLGAAVLAKRALFPPPGPRRGADNQKLVQEASIRQLEEYPPTAHTALMGDSILHGMGAPAFLGPGYGDFAVNGIEAPGLFPLAPVVNKVAQRAIILVGINSVRLRRPLPEIAAEILKLRSMIVIPTMLIAPLPITDGAYGMRSADVETLRVTLSAVSPPVTSLAGPSGQIRPEYTSDGVHLTARGYRALAAEIKRREAALSWR